MLRSGTYLPQVARRVVVWRKPDKNGTGDPVWIDQFDEQGRRIGKEQLRDKDGNVVRQYPVPDGFKNIVTSGNEDSWTYCPDGSVYRTPSGEAVVIKPGQAVVFEPDGSVTVLDDEWSQYRFALAHDNVDENEDESNA